MEDASLLREQEARGSNPRAPTSHLIALSGFPFAVGQHHSLRCILDQRILLVFRVQNCTALALEAPIG